QMRLVEHVEVGEDGAVVFFSGEIDALSRPPGGLDVKADVFERNHIAAEVDVEAALLRRKTAAGVGGRHERAAAQEYVNLLGRGELDDKQEGKNGYKDR